MKGRYDAVQLAKKVVSLANDNNMYISNLQLQKVMYYIQGSFMKKFNYKAFDDEIECWPYGPVVKRIWSVFNVFGRNPIRRCQSDLKLSENEQQEILRILKSKLRMNVWDLVDQTHEELPWSRANKMGMTCLRDCDMEEFFCK